MSLWRRYLLARAVWRLSQARLGLHLIPQGHELYRQISEHLLEVGGWAAPLVLLRLYWYDYCLERSVHHALRAEECRR